MEFDFSRYHGRRLVTSMWGDEALPWPELRSLILQLPDESAFARSIAAERGQRTDRAVAEAAQLVLLHALVGAWSDGRKMTPLPELLEQIRGTAVPRQEQPTKPRSMRDWMAALGPMAAGVPPPPTKGVSS